MHMCLKAEMIVEPKCDTLLKLLNKKRTKNSFFLLYMLKKDFAIKSISSSLCHFSPTSQHS